MADPLAKLACKLASASTEAIVKTGMIRLPPSIAAMIAAAAKDQALDINEQRMGE